MARGRDRPYAQFAFLIAADDGGPESAPVGGFQECSNVGMEVSVAEYRQTGDRRAAAGALGKCREGGTATLKAETMRSRTLRAWLDEDAKAAAEATGRTLLVHLRDEHGPEALLTWALQGARITWELSLLCRAPGTFQRRPGQLFEW
jgi:phage tail-like protein